MRRLIFLFIFAKKKLLPRDTDELASSALTFGAVIPGRSTAAVSYSLVSLKLSTYSSCEASLPCPGETAHRHTNSTHIPLVLMSRSLGKHPQKETEQRADVLLPPQRGKDDRKKREGRKEAERWINPGIDGAAPGTLCRGFLWPALHLCGPSTFHKGLLMQRGVRKWGGVLDRSPISSQAHPQSWETGQAGDERCWRLRVSKHTTELRSVSQASAGTLVHALHSVRVNLHPKLWAKSKTGFHCGAKTWQTCSVGTVTPHTIYIIARPVCSFCADRHQMAGRTVSPGFPSLYMSKHLNGESNLE